MKKMLKIGLILIVILINIKGINGQAHTKSLAVLQTKMNDTLIQYKSNDAFCTLDYSKGELKVHIPKRSFKPKKDEIDSTLQFFIENNIDLLIENEEWFVVKDKINADHTEETSGTITIDNISKEVTCEIRFDNQNTNWLNANSTSGEYPIRVSMIIRIKPKDFIDSVNLELVEIEIVEGFINRIN